MEELIEVNPQWLYRFNRSVPRYTSYPTAPQFQPLNEEIYRNHLSRLGAEPLSLYIHIPFCRSMCLFCGCSVILNRNPEKQKKYLDFLLQEIALVASHMEGKKSISQLHLGGGTPTSLNIAEFEILMQTLRRTFSFEPEAEISIEIDPRTVYADEGDKLEALRRIGFNRVSFGVQDLDPKVQEAVKRRQSEEMSRVTFEKARELGFEGINIDLIYGLPFQTVASFSQTVDTIASWRPDRIALFSYAKVPWLKPHQRAIPEESLPSTEEKFEIYARARSQFMKKGYIAIGMDHFSLPEDPLSIGYTQGKLYRNFQGYSLGLAENMVGLGVSSIGFVGQGYFQNVKELDEYESCLTLGKIPLSRGLVLNEEDKRRRWVIQSWMCHFEVDKTEFQRQFSLPFDLHFSACRLALDELIADGLVLASEDRYTATPIGRLFIRLIAAAFDEYLTPTLQFSQSV